MTSLTLQRWYNDINRRVYRGKLPAARVEFARLGETCAVTWWNRWGYVEPEIPLIQINSRFKWTVTGSAACLIHEVQHIVHWRAECGTPRFDQWICDLAKKWKPSAL